MTAEMRKRGWKWWIAEILRDCKDVDAASDSEDGTNGGSGEKVYE